METVSSLVRSSMPIVLRILVWNALVASLVTTSDPGGAGGPANASLDHFLEILRVKSVPRHGFRHTSAPQYMLDLYKFVADPDGLVLSPMPHHANVVFCYPDQDSRHQFRFFFNISSNASKRDKLLEAEFHLFKLKPKAKVKAKFLKSPLLEVMLYQILPRKDKYMKRKRKLLEVRRLSIFSSGWEIFHIKDAVNDWIINSKTNLGLLISIRSLEKQVIPKGMVRFAKQSHHRIKRHPLLVVFIDDGRQANRKYDPQKGYESDTFTKDLNEANPSIQSFPNSETSPSILTYWETNQTSTVRSKRGNTKDSNDVLSMSNCKRHKLYVDFKKIGWSAWIISPKGYNAYYCKGECLFPLGQNQWPTNHATVQSIVHELKLASGVQKPCCVPNKLYSISLLYFDEHENVILKQYDDMVAASCGCH